ncbi:MAG TPA: nickel-dependent hydrogenase large subunit [Rectinemataceae bacterium]|nr:nickel-dependent hydrogenase large subunit [Rectinemataceae bacterium]
MSAHEKAAPGPTVIPFGPQHPVLPEPLHFDLVLQDEKVVGAIPQIGYIHRGLELLVDKRDYLDYVHVAERICGICSFMHGMGYCEAVETVLGITVPDRARWLRTFWCELARVHSHLLWLGCGADALGFENLFMASWRARETVVDVAEETAGGRVIFGSALVGGVSKDPSDETLKRCVAAMKGVRAETLRLANIVMNESTVRHRFEGVGVLSKEMAYALGAVGPMLRASGVDYDVRRRGYAAYGEVDFETVVETGGDCMARALVRVREIEQSFHIIDQIVATMPAGPVAVPVKGMPPVGEAWVRLEQPRGEVLYYVRSNGTRNLERFRVRTPTFANVPAMVEAVKGASLADVPNIILTIDPCISCTER